MSASVIRLFSVFLSNVPSPDPPFNISSAKREEQRLFSHLSTLLNTGCPKSQVVAVTGCIGADGPKATIVVSPDPSTPQTGTAAEEDYFFKVESCEPTKLTYESVIQPELPPQSGVNVTDHIPDLFAALVHATTKLSPKSSPPRYAVTVHDFIRWLVHRCHAKISYRFKTAAKEWDQKPWDIMEKWSPSDEDLEKTQYSRIKTGSDYMRYIRRHAPNLTVDKDDVLFNRSTLEHWVHFLAKLLARADELSSSWWTLGEKGLRRLYEALAMIDFLLETEEIKFAILTTSLRKSFEPKWKFRRTRVVAEGDGTDDEELSEQPEPNEDAGEHVLRYLRTLTAWHTGGKAVVKTLRRMSKPPKISIIRLTDGSSTFGTDLDSMSREVQERIIATEPTLDPNIVSQWVDGILCVRKGRVHAEAGLMALAYYVKHDQVNAETEVPKDVFDVFLAMDVPPIGVSKKCCYLCHLLWIKLFENGDETASGNRYMKTHGYILPWDPPRFGIPDSVMQELANKLVNEAARHARDEAKVMRNASQQSSPESISSSLDDADEQMSWLSESDEES